jgi:hypothetical protein
MFVCGAAAFGESVNKPLHCVLYRREREKFMMDSTPFGMFLPSMPSIRELRDLFRDRHDIISMAQNNKLARTLYVCSE